MNRPVISRSLPQPVADKMGMAARFGVVDFEMGVPLAEGPPADHVPFPEIGQGTIHRRKADPGVLLTGELQQFVGIEMASLPKNFQDDTPTLCHPHCLLNTLHLYTSSYPRPLRHRKRRPPPFGAGLFR